MVAKRLTEAELAMNLPEFLAGARRPLRPLRELAVELSHLPPLDDDFAADIEAAKKILLPQEPPEWPD
jgi:hypothetical protein